MRSPLHLLPIAQSAGYSGPVGDPSGTDSLPRLPTREHATMTNEFFARRVKESTALLAAVFALFAVAPLFADDEPCNYPPASAIGPDGWINLFDGKDLNGWKQSDAKGSKVHVED